MCIRDRYLVDAEGNETSVKVNPGKTYLAVVDLEEAGKFSYDAGAAATDTTEVPTGDNSTLCLLYTSRCV